MAKNSCGRRALGLALSAGVEPQTPAEHDGPFLAAPAFDMLRANMEPGMEVRDIIRDTERYRDEAVRALRAINAGAPITTGVSRETAIRLLTESIVHYETVLRRYGWTDGEDS
jgi:hypothetical protein